MPLDDSFPSEVRKRKKLLEGHQHFVPGFVDNILRKRKGRCGCAERDDYVHELYLDLVENDYEGLKSFRLENLSEDDLEGAFKSWLYQRTVWHIGHDLRRQRRMVSWEGAAMDLPSGEPNAEERLMAEAERQMMDTAICQLRASDKTLLELRRQGLAMKEIAERTGRTPGAVRKRLSLLTKKLQNDCRAENCLKSGFEKI